VRDSWNERDDSRFASEYGLRLDDPVMLLQQLLAYETREQLEAEYGNDIYPLHMEVLLQYFMAGHDRRFELSASLEHLVSLGIPPMNAEGSTAGYIFSGQSWEPALELTQSLAAQYTAAGIIEVNKALPGSLSERHLRDLDPIEQQMSSGHTPLVGTIICHNPVAARWFLENGASVNVGATHAGGPDDDALSIAHALGASEVAAVISEHVMTQTLQSYRQTAVSKVSRMHRRTPL